MTVTTTPPSARVDDLGASEVLACLADAEGAERRAALSKLELALHWCVLHPATADTGAAVWGDAGLPGLSGCDETLGGDGCPAVSAFAPELSTPSADGPIADSPFAAALAISTSAGMQLLADGLDLAHRLPRTWGEVRALTVPAWKARRLAQATHHLSRAAAAQVDRRLADRIGSCGPALIDREVAQAAATFDPDQHAEREAASRDTWDVALFHHSDGGFAGTSELHATGDTLDLTSFYDVVCDQAAHLARLGDTDSLGARKAKALGLMAGHQSHLDLYGDPSAQRSRDNAESRPPLRRPSLARTRLYLHLRLTDLLDPTTKVGYAERLGPATADKIKEWLGASRATIVPVLDLARDDPVDQHDPPETMRETVVLRDRHCVFPWCTIDARSCDLDHIEPYVSPDDGGPPGQTAPANLAPLCRRHHRAKSAFRWRYRRRPDGTYIWHGPHHTTYVVTPDGTLAVNDA